jgi:hypothetical protein
MFHFDSVIEFRLKFVALCDADVVKWVFEQEALVNVGRGEFDEFEHFLVLLDALVEHVVDVAEGFLVGELVGADDDFGEVARQDGQAHSVESSHQHVGGAFHEFVDHSGEQGVVQGVVASRNPFVEVLH